MVLDPVLDDELRREGLAREIVNRVQRLRRDAGLEVTDRIRLRIGGAESVRAAVETHGDFIAGETLAEDLASATEGNGAGGGEEPGVAPEGGATRQVEIDGVTVELALERIQQRGVDHE